MREDEARLFADGALTPLGAKAVQLLAVLVSQRQRVVNKHELLSLAWPGQQVSEGNLHTQVSSLRAVLGDAAIATVAARGYRFTLPVDGDLELPATPAARDAGNGGGYRFGRYQVRPSQRALLLDDQRVKLGARAYDVLLALLERHDRLVSKAELLNVVWPDSEIEEGNLQTQVSNLRKLLGTEILETIPGRGYRFNAPLLGEPRHNGSAASHNGTPAALNETASVHAAPIAVELKTNLPEGLAPLLGRDDDLTALGAVMAEHRLVSIVAAGGMGKSRLAQQVLHDRRHAYKHGVCWVELAYLTDATLVPSAIASALGVPGGTGDALGSLVNSLKGLEVLICLDNVEYLVDEVARVVQAIVEGASGARLIVTSQIALKLGSEHVYRLDALAVPEDAQTVEHARTHGAVALFDARASAADRRFKLEPQNLATVIDICRRLDGMPLAIEMAAARVPLLGVQRLAATLDQRLTLLTGGRSEAPSRQKTLRAALDWSHGLLGASERVVFRRLAVFAGSFSLEMAQAVIADDPSDERGLGAWDVLDLLGTLVDRSLVVTLELAGHDRTPRYRLLESPKAFAGEQLRQHADEEHALRRRHAQAVIALFTKVDEDRWEGRIGVDPGIALLEPDLDNAREALAWLLENDHLGAVTLAPALFYGFTYDRYEDCRRFWEVTQAVLDEGMPLAVRAHWAMEASHFWANDNVNGRTTRLAQTAISAYRKLGERRGLLLACAHHMTTASMTDLTAEDRRKDVAALEDMAAATPMSPAVTHAVNFALGHTVFTLPAESDADAIVLLNEAERYFKLAAVSAGEAFDRMGRLMCESTLAHISQARRDWAAAIPSLRQLMSELDSGRDWYMYGIVVGNVLATYVETGQLDAAEALSARALRAATHLESEEATVNALALLAALRREPRNAARLLGYTDAGYAIRGAKRQPVEARMTAQVQSLAVADLGADEFERLRAEGRRLTREQVDEIVGAFSAARSSARASTPDPPPRPDAATGCS